MYDFWENVLKFPRFFVSSIIGLLVTLLGPFLNLLNSPQTTILLAFLTLISLITLILTLQAMLDLQ